MWTITVLPAVAAALALGLLAWQQATRIDREGERWLRDANRGFGVPLALGAFVTVAITVVQVLLLSSLGGR